MQFKDYTSIFVGILGIILFIIMSLVPRESQVWVAMGGLVLLAIGFLAFYLSKISSNERNIQELKKQIKIGERLHQIEKDIAEIKGVLKK